MMKYRLTEKQRQEYLQLREQLDTQERERLVKELEEAGADGEVQSRAEHEHEQRKAPENRVGQPVDEIDHFSFLP